MKPITPEEASRQAGDHIPDFVFEAVNNLIKKHFCHGKITIKQSEIVQEIIRLGNLHSDSQIFAEKWLDFEQAYRNAGWNVVYDKPGHNESYDAFFVFSK